MKQKVFWKISLFALFSLSAGLMLIYIWKTQRALPPHLLAHEKIANVSPSFTAYTLKKNPIKLSDFKNKVVLVNFWATWCAPCVEELPALNNLAEEYKTKIVILAISNEESNRIQDFLQSFKPFSNNFIPASIKKSQMLEFFPVTAFPETYIMNKEGKLIEKILGPQKWDSLKWKNKIKAFIEKKQQKNSNKLSIN